VLAGVDDGEGIFRWIMWIGFVPDVGIGFAGVGESTMLEVLVVVVFAVVGLVFA
jgi:hypothetical protein